MRKGTEKNARACVRACAAAHPVYARAGPLIPCTLVKERNREDEEEEEIVVRKVRGNSLLYKKGGKDRKKVAFLHWRWNHHYSFSNDMI